MDKTCYSPHFKVDRTYVYQDGLCKYCVYEKDLFHCAFVVHANDNVCVSITNDTSIRQSQTSLDTNTYTMIMTRAFRI